MVPDLQQTLDRGAAPPRDPLPDVGRLWQQAQRRQRRRTALTVSAIGTVAVAIVVIAGLVLANRGGANTSVRVPPASRAATGEVTVVAHDDAFTVTGSPGAGWNRVVFVNLGREYHAFELVSVKPGVTAARVQATATASSNIPKRLLRDDGVNPAVPVPLGPGQKTTIVTQLEPGHFVVVSPIAARAGGSQIARGAVGVIDVPNAASPLGEPDPKAPAIVIDDTSITMPETMAKGTINVTITNDGSTAHSFLLVKMQPGTSLDEVKAYLDPLAVGGMVFAQGTPPGVIVGGVSDLGPATTVSLEQILTPGHYGYASVDGAAPDDDYSNGLRGEFDVP
jgi:hypothetical protein